jgi:site-specific DNA-methyltransferase (adenine-specific)
MNSAVMFSKASDEWTTPQELYDALHAEFWFIVDAAATKHNAKCPNYYGIDDGDVSSRPYCWGDALLNEWSAIDHTAGAHWCNPPYSKCPEFVAKAAQERLRGALTVMLLPARTDTRWFHAHLWDAKTHRPQTGIELRFVKGRLKFGDSANSAPFPSMVVVFRP